MRANVLEDEVQVLPTDAGRLDELLLRHAAQLQAADVEVAEGDAVGVKFVLVTAELEPFPDMALGPVFRVHRCPVGVTGCTRAQRIKRRRSSRGSKDYSSYVSIFALYPVGGKGFRSGIPLQGSRSPSL